MADRRHRVLMTDAEFHRYANGLPPDAPALVEPVEKPGFRSSLSEIAFILLGALSGAGMGFLAGALIF